MSGQIFCSSHIFVFWFLVFWSLWLRDFLSDFFRLAHLALLNVNKDRIIFLYFCNIISKSDQKPKIKIGMNERLVMFLSKMFIGVNLMLCSINSVL